MLARKAAWTFETLTRMSKEHGSADYEYGSNCGSAKGAEQSVAFMCGDACAIRKILAAHVDLGYNLQAK